MNWRCKCYNAIVSNKFAASDKKLAILLLENNSVDLKLIKRTRRELDRNGHKLKHTKNDKEDDLGKSFQGWHKKGVKGTMSHVKQSRNREC